MSKKKIFLYLLFFVVPVLLFTGTYFYEFRTKTNNLLAKFIPFDSGNSKIFHSLSNSVTLAISSDFMTKMENNELEMKNLEIRETKNGGLVHNSSTYIKSVVKLKDKEIEIDEYAKLPTLKDGKYREYLLLKKKIFLSSEGKVMFTENIIADKITLDSEDIVKLHEKVKNLKNKILNVKGRRMSHIKMLMDKLFIGALNFDTISIDTLENFESILSIRLKHDLLKKWHKNILNKLQLLKKQKKILVTQIIKNQDNHSIQ